MIWVVHPRSGSRIRKKPIPDFRSSVKNAPDPVSGSATSGSSPDPDPQHWGLHVASVTILLLKDVQMLPVSRKILAKTDLT
jgi:hypothetical protein